MFSTAGEDGSKADEEKAVTVSFFDLFYKNIVSVMSSKAGKSDDGDGSSEDQPSKERGFLSNFDILNYDYVQPATSAMSSTAGEIGWERRNWKKLGKQVNSVPHLVPGKGVRFSVSVNYEKAEKKQEDDEAELLPYITYLDVNIDLPNNSESSMNSLFRFFSQMSKLEKVELKFGVVNACADYPGLLAALSNLQLLKEISLDYSKNDMVINGCKWERSSLHILPTVHTFSIVYSSLKHDDVVEQFHLPYVFPGLKHFECTFEQKMCNACEYDSEIPQSLDVYRDCAYQLTRGLVHLPSSVKDKIQVHFENFSGSLEELDYEFWNNK